MIVEKQMFQVSTFTAHGKATFGNWCMLSCCKTKHHLSVELYTIFRTVSF